MPGSPRSIVLNATSPTTLMAAWEDPEVLNGALEGFVLRLTSSEIGTLLIVANVSATVHRYTWTSLHPYFSYQVSILALTAAGQGPVVSKMIQMPEAGKKL